MFDSPLVSVIIPAFNAAQSIQNTLQSVLTQTYQNLEVLVVDDGSTDDTSNVVRQVAKQDARVKLLCQPNSGVALARNLAIAHAKGEFIAPIDADDIWYPDNIQKQVECLCKSEPTVGLVYSWSVDIDESNALLGTFRAADIQGNVYATLICHNFLGNASATMIRRSCLDQIGGYDHTFRLRNAQGCEDWDLYLRIASQYEFRVVPEFLVGYRRRTVSMSCDYSQMARSHNLIMQKVQQQKKYIPQFLFQLSSSNLYGYFAYQSCRHQDHRTTLYWLKKTVQAERVTPWIRPGFYKLLIQSSLKLNRYDSTELSSTGLPITVNDLYQRKHEIVLKILVGRLFHNVVLLMAQAPQKYIFRSSIRPQAVAMLAKIPIRP